MEQKQKQHWKKIKDYSTEHYMYASELLRRRDTIGVKKRETCDDVLDQTKRKWERKPNKRYNSGILGVCKISGVWVWMDMKWKP